MVAEALCSNTNSTDPMDTPCSNSQGGCPGSPGYMESGGVYANLGAEASGGEDVQGNG